MERTLKIAVGIVTACATLLAGAASAQAGHHRYELVKINCWTSTNALTGGPMVRAQVMVRMITSPHKKNNLRSMRIKARLVPDGPGISPQRNWRETTRSDVSADGANRKGLGVVTEPMTANEDWNVQVELRWNRRGKPDWNEKRTYRFNEGFCMEWPH